MEDCLECAVTKGDLRFRFDGISALTFSLVTGQRAATWWDRTSGVVKLKNLSSEGGVLLSLPDHTTVAVAPRDVYCAASAGKMAGRPSPPESDSSRLGAAVFFESPGGTDHLRGAAALQDRGLARLPSRIDSPQGHLGRGAPLAQSTADRKPLALLSAENRPEEIYATTRYSLRPQAGRLAAPRVFQPPATGF
jgi:hypothetical protein